MFFFLIWMVYYGFLWVFKTICRFVIGLVPTIPLIQTARDFWGVWFLPPFDHSCGLKSGVPLLGTAKIEKSSVVAREYGIGPRPFSFSVNEIKVTIDTRYAVWISCLANVAPKSNLIQLGSAHEWSGVGTKPFKRMPPRVESICTSSLAVKMERVKTYSGSNCLNFSVWETASPKLDFCLSSGERL